MTKFPPYFMFARQVDRERLPATIWQRDFALPGQKSSFYNPAVVVSVGVPDPSVVLPLPHHGVLQRQELGRVGRQIKLTLTIVPGLQRRASTANTPSPGRLGSSSETKQVISYISWGDRGIMSILSESLLVLEMFCVSTTSSFCRVCAMLLSRRLPPIVGTPLANKTRMWRQVVKVLGLTC